VLSNGPGNPARLELPARAAAAVAEYGVPVLAICLGHQLLALGMGARTYKLPYGHRGPNKPVVEPGSGRCYITTQNQEYAVDRASLDGPGLVPWSGSPGYGSTEGFKHERLSALAVQFHLEAGPGTRDTFWISKAFAREVERKCRGRAWRRS